MSVWKSDEKLLSFASLISPSLKSFCLGSNIKHWTQCFITRWNTCSKFVKSTPLRFLFSALFSVFYLVMNYVKPPQWRTAQTKKEIKHLTIQEKAKSSYYLFFAFSFHIYQKTFHFVGVSIGPWSTYLSIGRGGGGEGGGIILYAIPYPALAPPHFCPLLSCSLRATCSHC